MKMFDVHDSYRINNVRSSANVNSGLQSQHSYKTFITQKKKKLCLATFVSGFAREQIQKINNNIRNKTMTADVVISLHC